MFMMVVGGKGAMSSTIYGPYNISPITRAKWVAKLFGYSKMIKNDIC